MNEEPKEFPSEDDEFPVEEGVKEIALGEGEPDEPLPDPSLSLGDSLRRMSARAYGSVWDSFRWLIAGKARMSVAVGVFAALIVALGFAIFDMQREERMLEQKYPQAVSSDERYILYARDLINRAQYSKAEQILRSLLQRKSVTDLHADVLFYLGKCLAISAEDQSAEIEARQICDRFIEEFSTDPRVPAAHGLIAESLARSELYSDSTMRYRKLLRIVPDEERRREFEFFIARNHYMAENLPATLITLRSIRQKYPDTEVSRDAALLLARTFVKYGRGDDAEAILQGLLDEAPKTPHAAAAFGALAKIAADAGDYESAMGYCERWFKESPSTFNQVDVMLIFALAKLQTGAPEEALAVASDAAKSFPRSPGIVEAIVLRGRAYEALGQAKEAEDSYVEAAELVPDASSPRENLARMYQSMGKLSEAIEQMELAIRIAPDNDSLWLELARLHHLNDNIESAIAILDAFTFERQLSPRIGEAFLMLAHVQTGSGSMRDAYRTLERLEGVNTTTVKSAVVLEKQADILDAVGLHADAVEKYRLAVERGASPDAVKPKIAKALLDAGRARECLDELASSDLGSQSSEQSFNLLNLKARALMGLEKYPEARRAIREAISLRSGRENFSTLALLMQTNLALQDEEAASEIFELTLRLVLTDDPSIRASADSRRIILSWADWLYETGKYGRAAKVYFRVNRPMFPVADAAWALYQQGNCYYNMGDYTEADEIYERLAAEFAESEWVKFAAARKELIYLEAGT